jgi:hypothetical protein
MLSIAQMLMGTLVLTAPPGPFGDVRHPVTREVKARPAPRAPSSEGSFLGVAHLVYRQVITPIDGPRCSHRPSCSAYAREALGRHGLVGLWLSYDRLLRDSRSSAVRGLPVHLEDGRLYYLDPLTESTFWLP